MTDISAERFGFIIGADRDERIVTGTGQTVTVVGGSDLHELRTRRPTDRTLHVSKNYFRQPVRYQWDEFRCLVNCVTDPDQNPKVLANIERMLKDYRGRVINRPERVMTTTRDSSAKRLAGTPGAIIPKTLRFRSIGPAQVRAAFEKAGMGPAIVRIAGTHTGQVLGVFKDVETLLPRLQSRTDYIATQYVPYRAADGLFRKFRLFFIGDRMIFRHVMMSDAWNIHVRDRERFMVHRPDIADEWRRWHEQGVEGFAPSVRESLTAIRERIGLDFCGIDFGLSRDGALILFEANATMNFFPIADDPERPFLRSALAPARKAYDRMLYG